MNNEKKLIKIIELQNKLLFDLINVWNPDVIETKKELLNTIQEWKNFYEEDDVSCGI